MNKRKKRNYKIITEAIETSFKIQDIYEHISDRESVFVEIPSKELFVPRMTDKEIKDFEKTGLHKFYQGVYPNVIYVDNRIAFPVNSSLLQPYYQYLRYLASTQVSVWAYATPLTSQELSDIYKAVFGESIDFSDIEEVLETLDLDESLSEEEPVSGPELGLYEMREWMDEEEGEEFDREIMRLFEDRNVKSIYFSQILSPSKKFFQSYFSKFPAGKFFRKGDESLYGRVPVLSGHTGIAKSAFVKKLEDHTTNENLVSVNFGDGVSLQMRPEVVIFKTGSVAYRELEESVFAISKVGGGGAEYLVYQTPFFEKFFRASDQFRFFARKTLLSLINGKTEDGKEIPPEFRVVIDENGMAVHEKTGVALEDKDSVKRMVKEGDRDLKVVSLIYDSARPAVLFLDELDRNHALMVRNLTTSFIFNRSFQDELTFYSTYIVAAWNRVAPSERNSLSSFYITAKTASSASADLEERAFMARFEEVYLDPSSEEVYRPVIEYLVSRFEGSSCEDREKLCGVKEFLEGLSNVKIVHPSKTEYTLLYYIPGIPGSKDDTSYDDGGYTKQLLSGFATFRSYERLLKYLSKKKSERNPKDRIINMTFVKSLLGYLFPTTKDEMENPDRAYYALKKQIKAFGKYFAELVEKNLGYNPYDPGKVKGSEYEEYKDYLYKYLYERSSDVVLRESVYSGTPVALYGPPGLAKTSKAEALVWKLNEPLFEKIRGDENFKKEVVQFLRANGYQVSEDPEEVISILATKVLVMRVGSELMSNPSVISGSNAPMPLFTHPIIKGVMDLLSDANGGSVELEALKSLVEESISSIASGGGEALVKHRVPRAKVVVTERFLSTFKESRAVLILDEFTRANFVTQGSFFDALSERIIGGHVFPEDAFERVQVVATGNYNSSLFGTSVSEIDGALVARFANFFQEEPSMDDIDSYLHHFVEAALKTVNQELADPRAIEEFRSYILEKREEGKTDLRNLLFSMFTVSSREEGLREFIEWIKSKWEDETSEDNFGELELKINAPFPSPREVSHFFLNRLLPLWLPQLAKLDDQDSGITYRSLEEGSHYQDARITKLSGNIVKNKALRNPYILAKRIFNAGLGTIPRYPVPGVTKSLFHPFSGVVFIPKPAKDVFPKLYEALSKREEARELFNLDYQPYDLYFGGSYTLKVDEKTYNDHQFYLADNYSDIERALGKIPWNDIIAGEKEVEKEVVLYSKLMVLAAAHASGNVYQSIVELINAVKDGKIMFFPGFLRAYEKDSGINYNDEQHLETIRKSSKEQAETFAEVAIEIYRRYCNIKLSEALSTKTKKVVTGHRIYDTLVEDLGTVKTALGEKYGTHDLEALYELISSKYREMFGEINNQEVYSKIASEILSELNKLFVKRYKIYIEDARVILNNIDPDEESELDSEIQMALEYVRLITGPEGLANLIENLSGKIDSNVVREILGFVALAFGPRSGNVYHVSFSRDEFEEKAGNYLGDPSKVDNVGSILSEYVLEKLNPLRKSFGFTISSDPVYYQKLDPNTPFVPKMGIVAPGNVTLYGGVPLVPSLDYQDDPYAGKLGAVPSFLRSSLLNVYYYDKDTKTLYLVGVNIPYLIKDMSFSKDSERVIENKEVFLTHESNMFVVFANGLSLEIKTVSKDPVEPFAVKAAEEAVQSEEFSELMKQAESDPYAASLVNEVRVLAGKIESLRVFSSTNPNETANPPSKGDLVKLPGESLEYWVKANNHLLSTEGKIKDTTLQAISNFVRSQKYLDRYLSKLPLTYDFYSSYDSDSEFGSMLDFDDLDNIDFGDEDMEGDKGLQKTTTPQKVRGVKGRSDTLGKDKGFEGPPKEPSYEEETLARGKEGEGDGSEDSVGASRSSRRNAFTYITLLRKAINLAHQSISRSV